MTNFITNTFISDADYYATIDEFKKLFRNTPKIRKLLFGRKNFKSESLFEEILSQPSLRNEIWMELFDEMLQYIWNEFRLWETPEILVLVSK